MLCLGYMVLKSVLLLSCFLFFQIGLTMKEGEKLVSFNPLIKPVSKESSWEEVVSIKGLESSVSV